MWTWMRRLWSAAAASVALSGFSVALLHMPVIQVLVLAGFAALLVMAVVWSLRGGVEYAPSGMPLSVVGLLCGTTAVAVTGLTMEIGAVAVVLVGGLAVAGWSVHRRAPSRQRTGSHRGAGELADAGFRVEPQFPQTDQGLLEVDLKPIDEMSTHELCLAWRRSYVVLMTCAGTSADRTPVVELRRCYLDELERRDPSGFARWVTTARAASDPGRFIGSQQQQ